MIHPYRRALPFLLSGLISQFAAAHGHLEGAVPAAGGTVAASPSEIRLTFNEPVESRFSTIQLLDDKGKTVATGKVTSSPQAAQVLVLSGLPKLPAGTYQVRWRAVAADTHKTSGTFSFTVKAP